MPIVTIIRPSWLDVEKAIIFLMSFWVRAHIAVKRVVIAPRHSRMDCANLLFSVSGWKWINRKNGTHGNGNPPEFLPGESHRKRTKADYSPWGRKSWTRLNNQTTTTTHAANLKNGLAVSGYIWAYTYPVNYQFHSWLYTQ